ncbi:MAG: DNRLRE domain-containing protein, partial [bacterium]|nr:DNRLRE domain-containing protein [bacterium]
MLTCALLAGQPLAAQGDPHAVALVADADTYLRLGHPNQTQGNGSYLRIRSSGNNRALVHFDQERIEAIVAGGSLVTAQLERDIESNADNWTPDGGEVGVHRVSSPWDELLATWKCAADTDVYNSRPDCADPWDGGAFDPAPADTVLHTNGLSGWVQFDVTADVAAFLAGSTNHGWLVKKVNEGAPGMVHYSSREGACRQEPRLVLTVSDGGADATSPQLAMVAP